MGFLYLAKRETFRPAVIKRDIIIPAKAGI